MDGQSAEAKDGEALLAELMDLRAPQARYRDLVAQDVVEPVAGFAMAASRAAADEVLRDPEAFSSEGFLDLGNTRPLIPLSVDPPKHSSTARSSTRCSRRSRWTLAEDDITARVNHFIDAFVDRGHCNFTDELAVPFPSAVFLGLMGLPWDELDTFLRLKDGILRPGRATGRELVDPVERMAVQRDDGRRRSTPTSTPSSTSGRPEPETTSSRSSSTREIDGERLTREEILDICFLFLIAGLDTVTDSLTCFFAFLAQHPDHRRMLADRPVADPGRGRGAAALGDAGAGRAPHGDARPEVCGHAIAAGTVVMVGLGAANVDPAEFADAVRRPLRPRAVNRHVAFGGGVHRCLGSHLARRELRVALREWHRRIPDYELVPGTELVYTPGLRSVENLQLIWSL